ncbi:MAG: amidohydrolase family protein, partial [Rhodospirillales bacterium]|nr:amidohydrolase family protein [Rhodospirillales bacterium]
VLPDFLKQVGGPDLVARFEKARERGRPGRPKTVFWGGFSGSHTIGRATTMLPNLYARRIEEVGLDFCTLFPTLGFGIQVMPEDDVRAAACRAANMMYADMFKDQTRNMTPAALIPMHTPEEAIGELEFAVKELGFRAIMTCNEVLRPPAGLAGAGPGEMQYTPIALDSPYDYDPFWAKCVELKVAPAGHSTNYSGTHGSPTNYVYNRVGLFATFGHAATRALFMSGVTRKFPELNFAFLEGGVWWAVAMYNDLVEFWEKRNRDAMIEYHDPANIDFGLMEDMFRRYGNDYLTAERMLAARQTLTRDGRTNPGQDQDSINDWKALKIERAEDIKLLFTENFYFGCEADDSPNYTAFNTKANQFGAKIKALFSSDLGHWDVV